MLSRRSFLKSGFILGAIPYAAAASIKKNDSLPLLTRPPALKPGDTIGLITPASPLFEGQRTYIEAREKMQALGFKVKSGKNIFKKQGYLAGTIAERVADIHDMFADAEVRAIISIRGGYGSVQLLPHLNYQLISRNPKIFLGYSDITSLLIGLHQMTGLVTFHGPVAVSTFTDFSRKYFFETLCENKPVGEIEDAPFQSNLQTSNRIWTYRAGIAEGKLIGGNLTLLQATLGTPYEFDSDNAILFIEEVGEEPYDLDRLLTHLKLAGKFNRCKGVLFDNLESVKPAEYKPAFESTLSVEEIIDDIFKDFDFPVCVGFSIGHIKDKPTLPIGVKALLDAQRGRLSLLETAVS